MYLKIASLGVVNSMVEQFAPVIVSGFKGLNNRLDPIACGLVWQLQADNCLCDNAGFLTRCPGQYMIGSSYYKDTYGTRNERLLAIDSSDNLVQIDEHGTATVLHTGITGAPFQWAELGYALFLMSSTHHWAIYPNRAIEWGSLCPTVTTSYPLGDPISYRPPVGSVLGVRRDQLAIAVWEDDRDRSVVYFSRPGYPHEFRLERDYEIFTGRVTLLADTPLAFVIATDRAIYLSSYDSQMVKVAEYGATFGGGIYGDGEIIWFWTTQGLCKVTPFENLTDKQLAAVNRSFTTAALLNWQGSQYAIIHQNGQITPNKGPQPYTPKQVFAASIST